MSLDHAWMKGVPMDLRPRYYPKPPLKFKDIDIYIPLDAIENDYDFTEERRVLAECKMWEEDKERERLAEEERQRKLKEEAERLRLEEEERREQERLELEARADEHPAVNENHENDEVCGEINKMTLDEGKVQLEENNRVVPNINSNSSSKPNSPVSEEHSSSHPHPHGQMAVDTDNSSTSVPGSLPPSNPAQPQFQALNGYHYMMSNDLQQMGMYHHHHHHPHQALHHQTVPQYYNYYVPRPHPQAPVVQQQVPLPHPQQAPMVQPGTTPPPVLPYSNPNIMQQNAGTGAAPLPPQVLQPAPAPPSVPVHPPSTTTSPPSSQPQQQQSATTPAQDSGTNSPAGSEKSSSGQVQSQPIPVSRRVDLKDLSDFESDTANPFDNVELKSINDMEVLASVLKNHTAVSNQNSSQGPPPHSNQCPYPPRSTWQTNGYAFPPVSISSAPVSTTSIPQAPIPSPTQHLESQTAPPAAAVTASQAPPQPPTDSSASGVNSFTKLHFPFLSSMAASTSRGNRDSYGSTLYNRSYLPQSSSNSTDDFTSQNPFLSSYVQSHSPLHQHQYWPSHMSHVTPQPQNPYLTTTPTPAQNGPVMHQGTGFIPHSGPSTAPPTGSQHTLR